MLGDLGKPQLVRAAATELTIDEILSSRGARDASPLGGAITPGDPGPLHPHRDRVVADLDPGSEPLFRAYALKTVADARGELRPGDPGQVYDTLALAEDNEMTLSRKSLGAKMVSPMQYRVVTEVMPTWRELWRQRMRWQRGATAEHRSIRPHPCHPVRLVLGRHRPHLRRRSSCQRRVGACVASSSGGSRLGELRVCGVERVADGVSVHPDLGGRR